MLPSGPKRPLPLLERLPPAGVALDHNTNTYTTGVVPLEALYSRRCSEPAAHR
jgi:hypothetical protein